MADVPKLKTASVLLKYAAASGFRADWSAKSHADCPKPMSANRTLIAAAAEIARVAAVAGTGEDLRDAVAAALEAVYADIPDVKRRDEVAL